MSKYIKRINWPWVEIIDSFGPDEDTIIININELTTIWSRTNTRYYSGIRYKNGDWCEKLFSDEALKELKELIMTHVESNN